MAGLLDFYGDPQANMALAAGLLSGGNFGQAMGRGLAGAQAVQIAEQEKRLREAQANEYAMRAERAKQEQMQQQAAAQRDEQFNRALQQGAKPSELAQFFPEKVDLLKKLADAPNFGRQAVARTMEIEGPGGAKMVRQLDQYAQPVGDDLAGYVAPQGVNLGGKYVFTKPTAGQSFDITMSPAERDASARGWASNGIAQQRLAMDKAELGNGQKPPAGYRWKPDGTMEPIPGGPADMKLTGPGAKIQDAKDVLSILDMAEPLLKKSTGSYLGAGVDAGARAFGFSTTGAEAAAELKALQGALVSKMPKMSGPQSDKDVQLYREMAGQIGDTTIPVATRQAAMRTIRDLNEKYAGVPSGMSQDAPQQKKRISLADIAETARKSGKSTAEVTAAAREKGYEIGGN